MPRSLAERNRLVLENLRRADFTVRDLYRKKRILKQDFQVIRSDAILGLIQAADRFDPACGFKFCSYADRRMRGSIIDEYRRRTGWRRFANRRAMEEVPLTGESDEGDVLQVSLQVPATQDATIFTGERSTAIRAEIESLPPRERAIIWLYYIDGKAMRDIGVIMGCVESRISQLHSKAMKRLRQRKHLADFQ